MSRTHTRVTARVTRPRLLRPDLRRRFTLDRARAGQLALVLALLVSLAAGYRGLRTDREADEPAAVGQVLAVRDGELRVDAVRNWDVSQHSKGMPGMTIPDPLPDGYRRFWTDVTIHSTGGEGFVYEPKAFTVSGEGLGATAPHWASGGLDRVVPGAEATVTLLFQVPEQLDDVLLHLPGTTDTVILGSRGGGTTDHHETH